MGGPMAANLLAAGHTVRGFDPVPAASAAAAEKGAQVFDSGAAAAADADVVITMLPSGELVKRCYGEILPVAAAGTLFIDSSTISVNDARAVNELAATHGFVQLDAPVSGGVKGAVAGTLAFMVGGDEAALEKAGPVLEPLAGKVIHWRRRRGSGREGVQQHGAGGAADRRRRGVRVGREAGLVGAVVVRRDHGATGNCWAVHTNCPVPGPVPTSPANNDFKPGFATALMNKDLGLAMSAVASTGSSAPLGTHAAEIYAQFATDHAAEDFSAVIEMLRNG